MPEDIEELMTKVSLLEIKARRLSLESFSGEYHTTFKGQGLDFEDFREYQHGDEVRFLDWNITARTNTPHIRTFTEERELTVSHFQLNKMETRLAYYYSQAPRNSTFLHLREPSTPFVSLEKYLPSSQRTTPPL